MKEKSKKRPNKKAAHKEESLWVNVKDDKQMVELGLRVPVLSPRDESVWVKTPNEKRTLREYRHSYKGPMRCSSMPIKSIPVWSKLIIYLERNKEYPKTTISTECWQHEIPYIIGKYIVIDRKNSSKGKTFYKNIVKKYSYNGKTYSPGTLPFWGR